MMIDQQDLLLEELLATSCVLEKVFFLGHGPLTWKIYGNTQVL